MQTLPKLHKKSIEAMVLFLTPGRAPSYTIAGRRKNICPNKSSENIEYCKMIYMSKEKICLSKSFIVLDKSS